VYTSSVRDLAREQAGRPAGSAQRIVNDIARAVTILEGRGGGCGEVASRATAARARRRRADPSQGRAKPRAARKVSKAKRPVRRAKAKPGKERDAARTEEVTGHAPVDTDAILTKARNGAREPARR